MTEAAWTVGTGVQAAKEKAKPRGSGRSKPPEQTVGENTSPHGSRQRSRESRQTTFSSDVAPGTPKIRTPPKSPKSTGPRSAKHEESHDKEVHKHEGSQNQNRSSTHGVRRSNVHHREHQHRGHHGHGHHGPHKQVLLDDDAKLLVAKSNHPNFDVQEIVEASIHIANMKHAACMTARLHGGI